MNKKLLFIVWAGLFALCVGLGFVPNATGFGKFLLVLTGISFFLPPFLLAFGARKENNRRALRTLRLISIVSLSVTVLLIILNVMSVNFSAEAGLWLYVLLVMFSAPMACCQYGALSLFLWACLLFFTVQKPHPCQK